MTDYDPADNSIKCYAEAIEAIRLKHTDADGNLDIEAVSRLRCFAGRENGELQDEHTRRNADRVQREGDSC